MNRIHLFHFNYRMPHSHCLRHCAAGFVDLVSGAPAFGPAATNTQVPPPGLLSANKQIRSLLPSPPKQSEFVFQPAMPALNPSVAVQRAIDTLLSSGPSILKLVSQASKPGA